MNAFYDALASVLAFFYDLVPNYAIAITLLTLVVMIIVTPLTLKGTRSMMMMQQLQPEMRKIQQRYKDDREQLNAELLKFYKEKGINPLGGCLPLLVQAPIFLVLYQVLRGLTRRATDMGFDLGWASGQLGIGADPSQAPSFVRVFDPAYLSPSSTMYQNLHESTTMTSFGLDLAESPSDALSRGFIHFLPFLVLIAVVAVTGFVQQRQIQGRNPNTQINPQQQMIMKIMPIFLPVISFTLPAGLVLYFAVSNLYRIGQQAFISRSIYGITRKDKAEAKALKKAGGDEGGKATKELKAADDGEPAKSGAGSSGRSRRQKSSKGDDDPKGAQKSAEPSPGSSKKQDASASGSRNRNRSRGGRPRRDAPPTTLQPRARKKKR